MIKIANILLESTQFLLELAPKHGDLRVVSAVQRLSIFLLDRRIRQTLDCIEVKVLIDRRKLASARLHHLLSNDAAYGRVKAAHIARADLREQLKVLLVQLDVTPNLVDDFQEGVRILLIPWFGRPILACQKLMERLEGHVHLVWVIQLGVVKVDHVATQLVLLRLRETLERHLKRHLDLLHNATTHISREFASVANAECVRSQDGHFDGIAAVQFSHSFDLESDGEMILYLQFGR